MKEKWMECFISFMPNATLIEFFTLQTDVLKQFQQTLS